MRHILSVTMLTLLAACSPEMAKDASARQSSTASTASDFEVTLTWDDAAAKGTIKGFNIYIAAGKAGEPTLLSEVDASPAVVDTVKQPALKDFAGDEACFSVSSVSAASESERSEIVCTDL